MERLIEKLFYIKRKTKTKIEYHFLQIKERDDYFVCLAEQSNFHIVKTKKLQTKEQFAQILLNIYKSMYGADNVELEQRYRLLSEDQNKANTVFKFQTYLCEKEPDDIVYEYYEYNPHRDSFYGYDFIKCRKDTPILEVISHFLEISDLVSEDDELVFKKDVPVKRDFIVR
jgi:hypothetical protein